MLCRVQLLTTAICSSFTRIRVRRHRTAQFLSPVRHERDSQRRQPSSSPWRRVARPCRRITWRSSSMRSCSPTIRSHACGSPACPRSSARRGSPAGSAPPACSSSTAPATSSWRWRGDRTCPVLVIRADQLVHTPLVAPLLGGAAGGRGRDRGRARWRGGRRVPRRGGGRVPGDRRARAAAMTDRELRGHGRGRPDPARRDRAPPDRDAGRSAARRTRCCTGSWSSRRTTRSRATCTGRCRSR